MSEQVVDTTAEAQSPPITNGEIVHWMNPKPMSVGPAGVSAAAAGVFALGVATAIAGLALMRWLESQDMHRAWPTRRR